MHEPGIFSYRDSNEHEILNLTQDKNYLLSKPNWFISKSVFPDIIYRCAIRSGFRKEYAYELAYK